MCPEPEKQYQNIEQVNIKRNTTCHNNTILAFILYIPKLSFIIRRIGKLFDIKHFPVRFYIHTHNQYIPKNAFDKYHVNRIKFTVYKVRNTLTIV